MMASTMSFTVDGRPMGDKLSITSFGVSRWSGVYTTPGATPFTRMPSLAYSIARCRVTVSRPPLVIIGTAAVTAGSGCALSDGAVRDSAGGVADQEWLPDPQVREQPGGAGRLPMSDRRDRARGGRRAGNGSRLACSKTPREIALPRLTGSPRSEGKRTSKRLRAVRSCRLCRRGRQGGLNQPGVFSIHVGLQDRPAEPVDLAQDDVHVSFAVQDEESRCPWFHQRLDISYEVRADARRRDRADRRAGTSQRGADRRPGQGHAENQAGEEADRGAAENVGGHGELPSVERERSVRVPHHHRQIREDEEVLVPPEADDLVADLIHPVHVVITDCPQVAGCRHDRSSSWQEPRSAPRDRFDSRRAGQPRLEL